MGYLSQMWQSLGEGLSGSCFAGLGIGQGSPSDPLLHSRTSRLPFAGRDPEPPEYGKSTACPTSDGSTGTATSNANCGGPPSGSPSPLGRGGVHSGGSPESTSDSTSTDHTAAASPHASVQHVPGTGLRSQPDVSPNDASGARRGTDTGVPICKPDGESAGIDLAECGEAHFAGIGKHNVLPLSSLSVEAQKAVTAKFGVSQQFLVSFDKAVNSDIAHCLGEMPFKANFEGNKQSTCLHVHVPDTLIQYQDVLTEENATLSKTDRKDIRHSLGIPDIDIEPPHKVCVPTEYGMFDQVDLHVLPDQQVADFSDLDFSKQADRNYSLTVLQQAPRLIVLNLSGSTRANDRDKGLHRRWVTGLALKQYNQSKGFLIAREELTDDTVKDCRVRHLLTLPEVEFLPVQWCKYGLICPEDDQGSGIISNVTEIINAVKDSSDSLKKRKGKNPTSQGLTNCHLLNDILTQLKKKGWVSTRNEGTTIESYLTQDLHTGVATNAPRIADLFVEWLEAEELCDFDMANYHYLTESYPVCSPEISTENFPADFKVYEDPVAGTTVQPEELIAPAVGEALEEELEPEFDEDFKEPTEKQKRELYKIHRGVGHPQPNDFGRALRHAGVHRNLVRWAVKELRCPVCEGRVRPTAKRPGALPRCMKFNQVVGTDLVHIPDGGFHKTLLNIICWGTGFQMAVTVPDQTSASARNAFATGWVKHYGWPELVVTDQGPEFVGHEFTTYIGEHGCLHHFIDSQSPWQQGRTERAGESLKEDLRDIIEECAIITEPDFEIALTQALDARNRYVNRSGYSAHQRVFGHTLRLPGCLMSDDPVDRIAVATDPSTEFQRSAEIRDSAQRALFRHNDHEAIKRAGRQRSRIQPKQTIIIGDVVYVWRSSPRAKVKGWVGPGLVVCVNDRQTSV